MSCRVGRQRLLGRGRQAKLHLRRSYTVEFKVSVIKHFMNGNDIDMTVDRYFEGVTGVTRTSKQKLVYDWVSKRENLMARAKDARLVTQSRHRPCGLGLTLPDDVEERLVKWINDLRRDGVPISALMLRLKALELAEAAGLSRQDFKASWQWRRGFMKRHRYSFRAKTHHGQVTPEDACRRAQEFAHHVRCRMVAEGCSRIYNADQTGVFFELLPSTTISTTGSKTVWVRCGKKDKARLTAMLLADSEGNKYPLFLVLKTTLSKVTAVRAENERSRHGFGRHVWRELEGLQAAKNVRIYGNKAAWWNGYMTIEFLRFHFGDRSPFSDPVMLLLDDFSGHWVPEVLECARSLNVVLEKVPPGLTWLCQPADAVWIKPMKDRLRRYWVEFLGQQIQDMSRREEGEAFTMSAPHRTTVIDWAAKAWDDLPASTIKAGFRKCMLDESSDVGIEEEPETEDLQESIDAVVCQLDALHVLDSADSVLDEKDDVVDIALDEMSK